jgi:hypothetical protein
LWGLDLRTPGQYREAPDRSAFRAQAGLTRLVRATKISFARNESGIKRFYGNDLRRFGFVLDGPLDRPALVGENSQ